MGGEMKGTKMVMVFTTMDAWNGNGFHNHGCILVVKKKEVFG